MGDPGEDRTHGLQISTRAVARGEREKREERRGEVKTKSSLWSLLYPPSPFLFPQTTAFLSSSPSVRERRKRVVRSLMLYPTELRGRRFFQTKRFRAHFPRFVPASGGRVRSNQTFLFDVLLFLQCHFRISWGL